MSEITSTKITLGYGGGAFINVDGGKKDKDLCWMMINSGSLTKTVNVPSFISYDMDLDFDNATPNVRNDVALGCGLYGFQGSINFAITQSALNKLFNHEFINRNNVFDLYINDGSKGVEVKCCYWNQFSISGNPRQVLTGSLSFVSTNNQIENFEITDGWNKDYETDGGFDEKLIEYWNTGAKNVESFSLSFTREANPVYLNTASNNPAYIRVGKLDLTGQISSWKDLSETDSIYIANKTLSFYGFPVANSSSFSFEGIDSAGKYNYSFKLYNLTGSSKFSWEITGSNDQSSPQETIPKNIDGTLQKIHLGTQKQQESSSSSTI